MELNEVVADIADAMVHIDASREVYGTFSPGVGPFAERRLVLRMSQYLNTLPKYNGGVCIPHLTPDLLIPKEWAIEFKIVRTYGDNGNRNPPSQWCHDMIHPYAGNASVISDCYKLLEFRCEERKAVMAIAYEHAEPEDDIDLAPLLKSFDEIIKNVVFLRLSSPRIEIRRALDHRFYKTLRLFAWEVLGRANATTLAA